MKKKVYKNVKDVLLFAVSSNSSLIIFLEILIGIFLSIFSFLIFIKIGRDVFQNELVNLDTNISSFIFNFRSPLLTEIMTIISFFGSGIFLITASLVIILFLSIRNHKKEGVLFSFILLMGFIINNLLKILTKRPRPDVSPLLFEPTYSFPSGHSMNAFVFYASISYFIFHFTKNKKLAILISAFSIILIFLIGISRIYLGVHFPTDVIAGFIGGFWWFITAILLRQTINFYKFFKESKNLSGT